MNPGSSGAAAHGTRFSQHFAPLAENDSTASHSLHREEFCIGAYKVNGGRLTRVLIGQKKKGGLRYVGSARPTIADLRQRLFKLLRMLHVYTFCPFVGVPEMPSRSAFALTEHKMAQCQWVEANVKVWVEFEGWSVKGHLVNPRVVGVI